MSFNAWLELGHVQFALSLLAGAVDVVAALAMSGSVGAHVIRPRPGARSKGDLRARILGRQCEVLIAQCGRSADGIDSNYDDGEVKRVSGLICDDSRTRDSVALCFRRLFPVNRQPCNYNDREVALYLLVRDVGIGNCKREVIFTGSCGYTSESLVQVQLESGWQFTCDATPGIWREAAVCEQWEIEVFSRNNCLRGLRDNFQRLRIAHCSMCRRNRGSRQQNEKSATTSR
jgi:hypothetical protein